MGKFIRVTLMVFGTLFLLLVAVLAGGFYYLFHVSNVDKIDQATESDVRFIFNWSGLNSDQEFRIVHSYESRRSMLGDHTDIYCLQLSDVSIDPEIGAGKWVRGPEKNPLYARARERALRQVPYGGKNLPCLGPGVDANSDEVLADIEYLRLSDRRITDYSIFLLHMPSKRLLAVDYAS